MYFHIFNNFVFLHKLFKLKVLIFFKCIFVKKNLLFYSIGYESIYLLLAIWKLCFKLKITFSVLFQIKKHITYNISFEILSLIKKTHFIRGMTKFVSKIKQANKDIFTQIISFSCCNNQVATCRRVRKHFFLIFIEEEEKKLKFEFLPLHAMLCYVMLRW